jgi:hypothetical protein
MSKHTPITLTTATGHGVEVGDWITVSARDTRWWRRALHWLLRRPGHPVRRERYRVSKATPTTMTTEVRK